MLADGAMTRVPTSTEGQLEYLDILKVLPL